MSRKSVYVGLGLVVGLAGVATGLGALVRHEPEFYTQAAVPAGPEREKLSEEFRDKFWILVNEIIDSRAGGVEFTEQQINSYFEEKFIRSGLARECLPENVSSPRLVILSDRIRLGCRYQLGPWSTVISVDFRMWLAGKEPNVVALEIQGFKAGALPISAQSLVERVAEAAPQQMDISWYRYQGNPVALIRFQADRKRPTMQLRHLELDQGRILIAGAPLEGGPARSPLR